MVQPPAIALRISNDANGDAVIYITQDPSLNELSFALTWQGDADITFRGGPPVDESRITPTGPTSVYFTVTPFLTLAETQAITITPPAGWQAAWLSGWVLTPVADLTVRPGDSFVFRLGTLRADGQPQPGSFNVDSYNFPGLADAATQLSLALEMPPSAHKRLADVLTLSFVGGDTVYIDGGTAGTIPPNTLILRLDNTSAGPIVPAQQPWPNTPVFYLTFVSASSGPGYGALTTLERLKDITVSLAADYGTDWAVQDRRQQSPPHWAIYPESPEILGTGARALVEFKIAGIVTDFAPSSTNLYLQSSFILGYDDGCQALPIVKAAPQLAIQDFGAAANNLPAGTEVALSWTSFVANRCELSPVNGGSVPVPVQSKATYKIRPQRTTTYTLTAFDDARGARVSRPLTQDVQPVRFIQQLTAQPATGSHYGDPVTLSWQTSSATNCTIAPPIDGTSTVPLSSDGVVIHPAAAVSYTLTAQGQDGPVQSVLQLVPIPNGWQPQPGAGRWDTIGRPVILPDFNGKLWFLAGGPEDQSSAVFCSRTGFDWEFATKSAQYTPRGDAAGCVFGDRMWLMGGRTRSGAVNEVWSSGDGVNWQQSPPGTRWSPRSQHGCFVFAGKIWVTGGMGADGTLLNDIWSSADGTNWTQGPAATWPARRAFGTAVRNGAICILAGAGNGGALADAWQSGDGVYWQGLGRNRNWQPRSAPNVNVVGDRLYVIGGTGSDGQGISDSNILLPDDNWTLGLGPGWGRQTQNLGSAAFLGAQWFAGGAINGAANRTVWGLG